MDCIDELDKEILNELYIRSVQSFGFGFGFLTPKRSVQKFSFLFTYICLFSLIQACEWIMNDEWWIKSISVDIKIYGSFGKLILGLSDKSCESNGSSCLINEWVRNWVLKLNLPFLDSLGLLYSSKCMIPWSRMKSWIFFLSKKTWSSVHNGSTRHTTYSEPVGISSIMHSCRQSCSPWSAEDLGYFVFLVFLVVHVCTRLRHSRSRDSCTASVRYTLWSSALASTSSSVVEPIPGIWANLVHCPIYHIF